MLQIRVSKQTPAKAVHVQHVFQQLLITEFQLLTDIPQSVTCMADDSHMLYIGVVLDPNLHAQLQEASVENKEPV